MFFPTFFWGEGGQEGRTIFILKSSKSSLSLKGKGKASCLKVVYLNPSFLNFPSTLLVPLSNKVLTSILLGPRRCLNLVVDVSYPQTFGWAMKLTNATFRLTHLRLSCPLSREGLGVGEA